MNAHHAQIHGAKERLEIVPAIDRLASINRAEGRGSAAEQAEAIARTVIAEARDLLTEVVGDPSANQGATIDGLNAELDAAEEKISTREWLMDRVAENLDALLADLPFATEDHLNNARRLVTMLRTRENDGALSLDEIKAAAKAIAERQQLPKVVAVTPAKSMKRPSRKAFKKSGGMGEASVAKGDSGWIEWKGGKCPVPKDTYILFRRRDGRATEHFFPAGMARWEHYDDASDIIAYKVVA